MDKSVNLSRQNLKEINQGKMHYCETADFSNNSISNIPQLPINENIISLNLENNKIEFINETSFKYVNNLEKLNLGSNIITKIENFEPLAMLKELILSNNCLNVLENIEHLGKLSILDVSNNNISSIFIKSTLTQLTEINLSHNPIFSLGNIKNFPNLKVLILDNCFFSDITMFDGLKRLTKLSLSNNKIVDLSMINLPFLEYLDLSHNKLISLTGINKCHELSYLDVSYNLLSSDSFADCLSTKIKILKFSGMSLCNLSNIQKLIQSLEHLEIKDCYNFKIDDLSEFLILMKKLKRLETNNCFFNINPNNIFYPDINSFVSSNGENQEYFLYRKQILDLTLYRPFILDGIKVNRMEENLIKKVDVECETTAEIRPPESHTQIMSPKEEFPQHSFDFITEFKERKLIAKLVDIQNGYRRELNLKERTIDTSSLSSEEIKSLIRDLIRENNEYQILINAREEKIVLARKLMRKNEKLRARIEHRKPRDTSYDPINKNEIDKVIMELVKENQRLLDNFKLENYEAKYQKKILRKAKVKTLMSDYQILTPNLSEFNLVFAWIASKIDKPFIINQITKNYDANRFIKMESKYKWMQLYICYTDQWKPTNFLSENLCDLTDNLSTTFLICAMDAGSQAVDFNNYTSIEEFKTSDNSHDTILFTVENIQVIYVKNISRIYPIYKVEINL